MRQCKKEQNKTTAQKYRQRKCSEQGLVMTEYEQLEKKNIELRTRVDSDHIKSMLRKCNIPEYDLESL